MSTSGSRADMSVRIVTDADDADQSVLVVNATVVDMDTATDGQVLTVQSDGSILPETPAAAPVGAAGGVLAGTYPDPAFAADMATQQELNDAVALRASKSKTINTQTGDYTLALVDADAIVEMNKATANTLTVPPHSSVAFPTGTVIRVVQLGAGLTTVAAGAGVTIRSTGGVLAMAGQYDQTMLVKRGTNEWEMAPANAAYVPLAGGTSTGEQVAPDFKATGKTGATATPQILAGGTASGAPTTGAHVKGELVSDDAGAMWFCTVAGTPGTWVQVNKTSNDLAYESLASPIWLPATLFSPADATDGLTGEDWAAWLCPDGVSTIRSTTFVVPSTWASWSASLYWTLHTAGAGDVDWIGYYDQDAVAGDVGSGRTAGAAVPTTAPAVGVVANTALLAGISCNPSKLQLLRVARVGAAGPDTATGTAAALGVSISRAS